MNYWFTGDEHLGHENIIKYCNRPFKNAEEMDDTIIKNHNEVVGPEDTVFHLGDFTLKGMAIAENYIRRLNGKHIFLQGSHDKWLRDGKIMIEQEIDNIYVVMCHYPMRSWPLSFHGSIQLFGHCHGKMINNKNQLDVGVDTHDFYPYPLEEILIILNVKK